jgi:ketosteroid isomerase-like protein
MAQPPSPPEVFLALVNGVAEGRWEELPSLYAEQTHVVHPFDPLRAAALRTREALREHFTPTSGGPTLHRRAANITIHQTTDPEVIVAELEYQGIVPDTGEEFALPPSSCSGSGTARSSARETTSTISPQPECGVSSTPLSPRSASSDLTAYSDRLPNG